MPDLTGVHHLALTVRDLNVSVPWYSDLLGLQPIMDEEYDGGCAVILMQPQSHLFIGLHQHEGNNGQPFGETHTGLDHISFAVPSRTELENWEKHLDERNIHRSPIADTPYGSVLVFRDPDNIQLEFMANPQGQ